jgi:hypothetical protein
MGFIKHRLFALILLSTSLYSAAVEGKDPESGKSLPPEKEKFLYETACAACHGITGTGMPRETVGFELPLPDLSDCQFAPREPDADWFAVIHDGGPARAFDRRMPAFGEALSSDEIQAVLNYVRSLCHSKAWPRGELNLPRPQFTEKAFPEDEAVLETSVAANESGDVLNQLIYEKRIGSRSQFEILVPFEAVEENGNGWNAGIGDIAIGTKRVLYHSLDRGTILSVIGEVILPTGNDDKGLGKGVTVIEPALAFGQILPADSFIQFHGGFEFPTDQDRAANEAFWRIAAGRSFNQGRFGRTWSPMIEILGAKELESGSKIHWDLAPQFQMTLSTRQHIRLNAGVRFPINDTEGRPTQILFYFLWDWFDGGLFDGW